MRFPRVGGKRAVEALLRAGFEVHRIRGGHYILKHPVSGCRVTVPYHRRELAIKTLRTILRQADLSAEQFADFL
ncbi:MAG: type II toxin-antitoxin system HicA family toxin [Chloroflexi bacterium]|nr:type II toxin-antitoxin system HicA family toxin [Chloroflexota bacterium]